jgi:hypothetical protein
LKQYVAGAIGGSCAWDAASAQDPVKIDFARDVQPLFKAHCMDCHGPNQRRADVTFHQKAGCVSCDNNTLTAMTVATALLRGRFSSRTRPVESRGGDQLGRDGSCACGTVIDRMP